ncbi:hypothetical protein [Natrinema gelatinilyticum]|nr:hypothetical protein [Natrinema gelatinilyticum]
MVLRILLGIGEIVLFTLVFLFLTRAALSFYVFYRSVGAVEHTADER